MFGLPAAMRINLILLLLSTCLTASDLPVVEGLILDLNAEVGITLEDGNKVAQWENQAPEGSARLFVKQDKGRKIAGSGRPLLRNDIVDLNGKSSLVFRQGELVNHDEDTFDSLITGTGFTWLSVVCAHQQRRGLKNVNALFGNLRNGGKYEGIWACLKDDNSLWTSPRNGVTFGRFDKNNPLLLGPVLEKERFYVLAGRMAAGKGLVPAELYLNVTKPVASAMFPVNPEANASKLVIGQERDAINHPGFESFDGEIARLLIYRRPLNDEELAISITHLMRTYAIKIGRVK
jgi:hypothetical protein